MEAVAITAVTEKQKGTGDVWQEALWCDGLGAHPGAGTVTAEFCGPHCGRCVESEHPGVPLLSTVNVLLCMSQEHGAVTQDAGAGVLRINTEPRRKVIGESLGAGQRGGRDESQGRWSLSH